MKYTIISLLVVILISCASRPVPVTVPVEVAPTKTEPRETIPVQEYTPFERALLNVKENTSLIKKYFKDDEDVLTSTGIDTTNKILVKGNCRIDGNDFLVTYDLAKSVKLDKDRYRIPFLLEDLTTGASHRDEMIWIPGVDKSGILLSFDDHYWHVWRMYFKMFDNYGAKVTFFVQGNYIHDGAPPLSPPGLRTFCIDALRHGHDVGYHTLSHPNLNNISRESFNRETIRGAEPFFKAGIQFSSFAYPYGTSRPWMREALVPFFPITRGYGVNIRIYSGESINKDYVISKAIDNFLYPNDSKFENDINYLLLAVKFSGNSILPLTSHIMSDTAAYGLKPKRLEFLLKTAQDLKLNFYTYRDVQQLFPRNN